MRLPRPVYIAWRLFESLCQVGSRLFNAVFLNGSTRQTTSARAHIEQWAAERYIDAFFLHLPFWWEENHCANAWADEVKDALKTLALNEVLAPKKDEIEGLRG